VRVRKAIDMAFDKETYLTSVHGKGNAIPAINPYPPTMLGFNTSH
jgi:dipeptide transport system substrate-binding protein